MEKLNKYDFVRVEKKWQKKWEEGKIFEVKENKNKKKFYLTEMFPYPSAEGLHMGHVLNYTIGDVYARFKRMNGFNVLHPMGYDSFGLPAENAAIKAKQHPKDYTKNSIKNYIRQQKELGLSYDWGRILSTCDPEYYKWNQYFFLKFFEKGMVYRKKAPVNWCSKCGTVLANEQVHNGNCWRHENTEVEIKHLEQWFIKITAYAQELLDCIDDLDWPEKIKIMQKNWIGKSQGTEIYFEIKTPNKISQKWPIFTTRPDTLYGVTFMVIAAQHPLLMEIVTKDQQKQVESFLKMIKSVSQKSIKETEELDKEGVFTGSYAINPLTKEKIPIYAGNFVIAEYGSGMVMAVPAHDQRDFEFAKKYNIPLKVVIQPGLYELNENEITKAFTGEGNLINSDSFNGLFNKEAIEKITKHLSKKKLGKKSIQYKLRDWLISRQRYWGTPIPIVYCKKCGIVPVSEKQLPIKLPQKVIFGKGNPLLTNKEFLNVKCPKCNEDAKRETDTMDTFVDSAWYYFRYCDAKNNKSPFNKEKLSHWMPLDKYIGGAEHACMHLMYSRFFTKALRDFGFFGKKQLNEPFKSLFNQGMLHGENGEKMSKSRGNVINPDIVSKKYGMDTARFFLLALATPEKDRNWNEKGIQGSLKLMNNIINYFENIEVGKTDARIESKINQTIKDVTREIEEFRFNLAIIKIRNLFNSLPLKISADSLEKFLKLLHPFCPHITEELWEKINKKGFISLSSWPKVDEKKINELFEKQEQVVEKISGDINHIVKLINKKINKCFIYVLPNEITLYKDNLESIKKKTGLKIEIFSVSDKNKYDPENKSKKAKPEKPGIYLE